MTPTTERPLALVTGASSGIGLELARQFGANGYDLLINAEDAGIETAANELSTNDTHVTAVVADLSTLDGVEKLHAAVTATGRPLAAAALNAGVGEGGAFLRTDLAAEFEIIDVNVRGTVHLAKLVLRDMAARDEGDVLITSSIASTMPGSFQTVYNASKSFLQSFAEALQNELKDTNLTVTSLMPGPTETNFFHRAGMDDTKVGQSEKDDPAQVARQGFEALTRGRKRVVGGSLKTKAQEAMNKVLPDRAKAAAHRSMAEPGSGEK
ncbi:MAG TPA: SDR family NAD(P)-dependent oxidoreductase [Pseudonocardiaceae bacterium]|jgi:short-subunit dehydrogenase|nr:SDR family NAD(P)-dependent oxidoreductase [Pseudonocardiaceae bacterium]